MVLIADEQVDLLTEHVLTLPITPVSNLVRTPHGQGHIAQVDRAWDPHCIRIPLLVLVLPPGEKRYTNTIPVFAKYMYPEKSRIWIYFKF